MTREIFRCLLKCYNVFRSSISYVAMHNLCRQIVKTLLSHYYMDLVYFQYKV